MSDTLTITSGAGPDNWVITAYLSATTLLPAEIFLYENLGTTELGRYVGVADVSQLGLYQVWSGTAIPTFGNAYVRYAQAKIVLPLGDDDLVVRTTTNLIATAKALKSAFQSAASSTSSVVL